MIYNQLSGLPEDNGESRDRDLSLQELEEIRQRLGEEIEKQKGEGE